MKNTFGENLRNLRATLNLSQEELATVLNTSKQVISRYETGQRTPKITTVREYAERLGIPPTTLAGYQPLADQGAGDSGESLDQSEQNHIKKYRLCDERGREMVDTVLDYEYHRTLRLDAPKPPKLDKVEIPVYLEPAAAGCGAYLENDYCDMVEFPAHDVPHGADFGVRISGNSMEPDIPDGCIAFVKSMPAIEDGEVGIFYLENKGYCKKIHIDHQNQRLSLVSTNKEYDPIYILPEETLYTFGKVLGHTMAEV